jgi:hypothetical protein
MEGRDEDSVDAASARLLVPPLPAAAVNALPMLGRCFNAQWRGLSEAERAIRRVSAHPGYITLGPPLGEGVKKALGDPLLSARLGHMQLVKAIVVATPDTPLTARSLRAHHDAIIDHEGRRAGVAPGMPAYRRYVYALGQFHDRVGAHVKKLCGAACEVGDVRGHRDNPAHMRDMTDLSPHTLLEGAHYAMLDAPESVEQADSALSMLHTLMTHLDHRHGLRRSRQALPELGR